MGAMGWGLQVMGERWGLRIGEGALSLRQKMKTVMFV